LTFSLTLSGSMYTHINHMEMEMSCGRGYDTTTIIKKSFRFMRIDYIVYKQHFYLTMRLTRMLCKDRSRHDEENPIKNV